MKPNYKILLQHLSLAFGVLLAIFLFLNLLGKIFIEEISQELFIEEQNGADPETSAKTNDIVPYFEIQNLKGKIVRSGDFRDAPLLIVFWNTWNENSANQIKILDDISREGPRFFEIVAINSQDNKTRVSSFLERGLYKNIQVLLDINGSVSDVYVARNLPAFYFVDKNGILLDRYYGFLSKGEIVEKMAKFSN
jgi:thiol-disulfide isomerase/thioredoxin